MDALISLLLSLGLSQYESKAYVALVQEFPANPHQIGKRSGVPTAKIYEVMARLEARGLVLKATGQQKGFVPRDPQEAFGEWEKAYASGLQKTVEALAHVMPKSAPTTIWHVETTGGVLNFGRTLIQEAGESVTFSGAAELLGHWQDALLEARERGVFISATYTGTLSEVLADLNCLKMIVSQYGNPRASVLIGDTQRALFVMPNTETEEMQGTWTDDSAMVQFAEQAASDKVFIHNTTQNGWIPARDAG